MRKQVDEETQEIITSFIAEGFERLDDAETQLSKLSEGDVAPRLNAVFRLFHSVKGSAGYLGFDAIKRLTHEAEALLDAHLKGGFPPSPESLDVIYATIDSLRKLIELVERDNADEEGLAAAEEQIAVLSASIAACRPDSRPAAQKAPAGGPPSAKPETATAHDPSAPSSASSDAAAAAPVAPGVAAPAMPGAAASSAADAATQAADPGTLGPNRIVLSDLVTREMAERFVLECADLADRAERVALGLSGSSDWNEVIHDIFRTVHTIKGNAGFFGYVALERACQEFEALLDGARKGIVAPNEALFNSAIAHIDRLRGIWGRVAIVDAEAAAAADAASAVEASAAGAGTTQREAPGRSLDYKPIGEILVDIGAVREDEISRALELQERPLGEILVEQGAVKSEDLDKALELQRSRAAAGEKRPVEEVQRKEIRVDTAKLDKLFNLVGELITAEAIVYNSPDIAGLKFDGFQRAFASLAKISREIQETTMVIRMIPLEGLFQKMVRLVRDLSRKFEKPIDLRVTGQDTEMDKNVIEQISDPLVHILRNAIDHGIDAPEARARAGKPEAGVIHLDARYEGSEIWVSVKDDGAGLNRARILAKAAERGMLKGDPALLPDREVWDFIFEPGFSTAEKVSEVSGRGVGMDVVKKNLERIRGTVDVRSEAGLGTEFVLRIPLTMAIIDGITVRAGRSFYSIPMGDILEFFKASPAQLTATEGGEFTVNLRGDIMPLVKLGDVFGVKDAASDPADGILIVVHSDGHRACLLIDEVVGNQQIVVKSLSEYLGRIEGLSGCSILGDGKVSFIVDTARLIARKVE
ncbi:MAG: chemotaxis protein CheA [Spirochaetaceae bacterium]|nr:chemotaxis protein CheA [Spirochaetaceae bacterium]